MQKYYTMAEVAQMCQASRSVVSRWYRLGWIKASGLTRHGKPLFTREDLAVVVKERAKYLGMKQVYDDFVRETSAQ